MTGSGRRSCSIRKAKNARSIVARPPGCSIWPTAANSARPAEQLLKAAEYYLDKIARTFADRGCDEKAAPEVETGPPAAV
jgi:hypothetical protein